MPINMEYPIIEESARDVIQIGDYVSVCFGVTKEGEIVSIPDPKYPGQMISAAISRRKRNGSSYIDFTAIRKYAGDETPYIDEDLSFAGGITGAEAKKSLRS